MFNLFSKSENLPHEEAFNEFIRLKSDTPTLLNENGEVMTAPPSRLGKGQVATLERNLEEFLRDPTGVTYDKFGYAFEFMTYRVLKHFLKGRYDVLPTPADWDYKEPNSPVISSDIMLGRYVDDGTFQVAFFIRTNLYENMDPNTLQYGTYIPVLTITGRDAFGKNETKSAIEEFALTPFNEFIENSAVAKNLAGHVIAKILDLN